MKKKKMMPIALVLLIGLAAAGGLLALRRFHSADSSGEAAPLTDSDPIKMIIYSCSGGSDAQQSFYFSLQKEEGRALFSCEYFEGDHGGDREKYVVEDAELPAETFARLMELVADLSFPEGRGEADDGILALDAESYSLTLRCSSGQSRRLESHTGLKEIEAFFREIKLDDE